MQVYFYLLLFLFFNHAQISKTCKHTIVIQVSEIMKRSIILYEANQDKFIQDYKREVIQGLSKKEKSLPFKYNYDEEGSNLCALIQQCPEYYLWSKDKKLLEDQGDKMLQMIGDSKFNLVDLGAGDATKTRILIKKALDKGLDIEYVPIDISYHANMGIIEEFKELFPTLRVTAITSLFEDGLEWVKKNLEGKSAIFIVGSTFGNSELKQNRQFIEMAQKNMKSGDLFFVSLDLWKSPETITRSYLDNGYEGDFILNNLKRINKELGGNFNLSNFYPFPYFDPYTNVMKGVLVSKVNQKVKIGDEEIEFNQTQPIVMWISRKWIIGDLNKMFEPFSFAKTGDFVDEEKCFAYASYQRV